MTLDAEARIAKLERERDQAKADARTIMLQMRSEVQDAVKDSSVRIAELEAQLLAAQPARSAASSMRRRTDVPMPTEIRCPAGHVGPFTYYTTQALTFPAVARGNRVFIRGDEYDTTDWDNRQGLTCEHIVPLDARPDPTNPHFSYTYTRCSIEFWPIMPVEVDDVIGRDDLVATFNAMYKRDEHLDDAEYLVELATRGLQ